jgi:hypothetical protein
MKKPNTGTIFDRYVHYTDFLRDLTVTEDDLLSLVRHEPYVSGTCRYVTRHPNCTTNVVQEMTRSPLWFMRLVGYFHFKHVDDKTAVETAKRIVAENTEDCRVLKQAKKIATWEFTQELS